MKKLRLNWRSQQARQADDVFTASAMVGAVLSDEAAYVDITDRQFRDSCCRSASTVVGVTLESCCSMAVCLLSQCRHTGEGVVQTGKMASRKGVLLEDCS